MISQAQINEIRMKMASEPYIWLIDLFNSSDDIIHRITNFDQNFVFRNHTYFEFPFLVSIPEISESISQSVQLTIANFKTANIQQIKQNIYDTVKMISYSINKKFPDDDLFPPSVFFKTKNDFVSVDDRTIRATFSRRSIQDKSYPFRRYNSVDHPALYQDFDEAVNK